MKNELLHLCGPLAPGDQWSDAGVEHRTVHGVADHQVVALLGADKVVVSDHRRCEGATIGGCGVDLLRAAQVEHFLRTGAGRQDDRAVEAEKRNVACDRQFSDDVGNLRIHVGCAVGHLLDVPLRDQRILRAGELRRDRRAAVHPGLGRRQHKLAARQQQQQSCAADEPDTSKGSRHGGFPPL